MTRLVYACDKDRDDGWVLCPCFLKDVQVKLNYKKDPLTLKEIERILLNNTEAYK